VALQIFYASIFYPFANFRQLSNCGWLNQIGKDNNNTPLVDLEKNVIRHSRQAAVLCLD